MSSSKKKTQKRAFFKYIELFTSRFSKLILLNLAYFVCILPLFCGVIYFLCTMYQIPPELLKPFFLVHLVLYVISYIPGPVALILFLASALAYGPLTAGLTHAVKCIVTEKHIWVSDIFSRAKSNLKQGMFFGILDLAIFFSFLFYTSADLSTLIGGAEIFYKTARILIIIISIIYFMIRFYSYTIAVSFELSVKDIIKNCLIFCVLGFFRNILAIICVFLIVFSFTSTPRIDVVLTAVLLFSLCRFTAVFITYPTVEKYMIKLPNKKAKKEKQTEEKTSA